MAVSSFLKSISKQPSSADPISRWVRHCRTPSGSSTPNQRGDGELARGRRPGQAAAALVAGVLKQGGAPRHDFPVRHVWHRRGRHRHPHIHAQRTLLTANHRGSTVLRSPRTIAMRDCGPVRRSISRSKAQRLVEFRLGRPTDSVLRRPSPPVAPPMASGLRGINVHGGSPRRKEHSNSGRNCS
jgi:hypothetical protein